MQIIIGNKILPANAKGEATAAPTEGGAAVVEPISMERNFPDFLAAYREYTKGHEASAKVHMWTGISCIAAAMERKVWLDEGYYKLYPNLYTFIIGAPGLVKKSTSTAIGVDLLRELSGMKIMAERVTAASLIDQMHRAGDKFVHQGQDIRQSSVFCYASELNVFLNEVFGSTTELLTTFFDCQPNDSSKPWVYETKGAGQIKVYGPCLNVLGCSTPAWLAESIPVSQMAGGFSSRVLYVVETEIPDTFVAWPEIDTSKAAMREKLLHDLKVVHALSGSVTFTPEAKAFYSDWYENHMRSLAGARYNPNFAGYYGRKGTMAKKLAIVASVSEGNSLVCDIPHVAKAIAWLDGLEKTMMAAFGVAGKNQTAQVLIAVLELLQKSSRVSSADLLAAFFHDTDGETLNKVLADLKQMGLVVLMGDGSGVSYQITERGQKLNLRSLQMS